MADNERPEQSRKQFVRPAWPYLNAPAKGTDGMDVSQEAYDALVAERDRLLRLCQAHGLMRNDG